MEGWIYRWVDGGWRDGYTDVWMGDGGMDIQMGGWADGYTDGWIDGWREGQMYR